jgi:hypothetical protein
MGEIVAEGVRHGFKAWLDVALHPVIVSLHAVAVR